MSKKRQVESGKIKAGLGRSSTSYVPCQVSFSRKNGVFTSSSREMEGNGRLL